MARAPRIEPSDGWYHVTARGNERKAIFRSDRDRHHVCELLPEHTAIRWLEQRVCGDRCGKAAGTKTLGQMENEMKRGDPEQPSVTNLALSVLGIVWLDLRSIWKTVRYCADC